MMSDDEVRGMAKRGVYPVIYTMWLSDGFNHLIVGDPEEKSPGRRHTLYCGLHPA